MSTASPGRYVPALALEHLGYVQSEILDGAKSALKHRDDNTFQALIDLCHKLQENSRLLETVVCDDEPPPPIPPDLPFVEATPPLDIDGDTLRKQRYRRGMSQLTLAREMTKSGIAMRDYEIGGAEHNRNASAAAKIATWFHEHPFPSTA